MTSNHQIVFISAVLNYEMYGQCFLQNSCINQFELISFNNNEQNLSVSQRYNQFLNSYNFSREAWFVFCHEDFLVNETDLEIKLNTLDKNSIYGPIGSRAEKNKFTVSFNNKNHEFPLKYLCGKIVQRNKDGSGKKIIGTISASLDRVDTLDCCCLIVHSSLIQRHGLRFDEKLSFDLYVEDFCINAKENYAIQSFVFPFNCEHWSSGNITERYYQNLGYLNQKYPNALYAGSCSFIGGKTVELAKKTADLLPFIYACNRFGLVYLINLALKVLWPLLNNLFSLTAKNRNK
ncbi:MAG: hypothetical protein SFU25_00200 [Candidatus Caenarcaniphilales bacterium]|nr:hypothetical protein [Candidatus Caenarcaniphilales bacterium]